MANIHAPQLNHSQALLDNQTTSQMEQPTVSGQHSDLMISSLDMVSLQQRLYDLNLKNSGLLSEEEAKASNTQS
jgi:hypothetical protein